MTSRIIRDVTEIKETEPGEFCLWLSLDGCRAGYLKKVSPTCSFYHYTWTLTDADALSLIPLADFILHEDKIEKIKNRLGTPQEIK